MHPTSLSPTYSKTEPFQATLLQRYTLNQPGSQKDTQHVVLDLSGSGIQYRPGDCLGVLPCNASSWVQNLLEEMGATGEETVRDPRTEKNLSFRDFLTHRANLTKVPKKLLRLLAERLPPGEKQRTLQDILEKRATLDTKSFLSQYWLWDFLKAFEGNRIQPQELVSLVQGMVPRLYSIASSQSVVGQEVHLTLGMVHYITNSQSRFGVATHFLGKEAHIASTSIPIYLKPTKDFLLPQDPSTPIIMVGPGTGIAPFRAFMQERIAQGATGKNWLFFGDWNRATDSLYHEEWHPLVESGQLRLNLSFSRDQEEKVYVQHAMRQEGKELWEWLEQGAVLYVCGDASRMAKDVDETLRQIAQEQGGLDADEAKKYFKSLKKQQRYLRDVY